MPGPRTSFNPMTRLRTNHVRFLKAGRERSPLPRRGVTPRPGDRVTFALHCSVHDAGHRLHHNSVGRLTVKEIQEGAKVGRRDHVWTAMRLIVTQVVEDEYDPGASLDLRGRLRIE